MASGFFISLDGPDGGGKSVQAARLVAALERRGEAVVACQDPGGTRLGRRIRSLVLDRADDDLAPSLRAEMLLFMASRAQLVDEVIQPALDAGKIVVSDRYLLANAVYQGYAGGLPVGAVWQVGQIATRGLMPDLTLLLDLFPEAAEARIGPPRDRIEDRPVEYREKVRLGFLDAARDDYPTPIVVIDASRSEDEVAEQVLSEVERALGSRPRS